MMLEHTVERYEGECCMTHPSTDDPRFKSFVSLLIEHGLLNEEGVAIVPHRIMRGVGPNGYLYRAIWNA
jgi:hypothetical protein